MTTDDGNAHKAPSALLQGVLTPGVQADTAGQRLAEDEDAAKAVRDALAAAIDGASPQVRHFQAELCNGGALRQLYDLAVARRPIAFEALRLLSYRNRIVVQQLANMGAVELLEQILVREAHSGSSGGPLQSAALQLLTSLLAFNLEVHSQVMRTRLVKRLVQLCRSDTHEAGQQQRQQKGSGSGAVGEEPAGPRGASATGDGGDSNSSSRQAETAAEQQQQQRDASATTSTAAAATPAAAAAAPSSSGDAAAAAADADNNSDSSTGAGGAEQQPAGAGPGPPTGPTTPAAATPPAGGLSPVAAHPDAPTFHSQEQHPQSMSACAAVALRNLCHQVANHPGLLAAGAALELAAVMQREADPYQRINATMAVALLVGHEEQHPLLRMDEEGIREMLTVLTCARARVMCHGFYWTVWKVCQALARLSANEDNKQLLTREGGIEVLAEVLMCEEHRRKAITVKYCVEALWNMAFYEPARQKILANAALMDAIRHARQSGLDLVREVARGCLFTLGAKESADGRPPTHNHPHHPHHHHHADQHHHQQQQPHAAPASPSAFAAAAQIPDGPRPHGDPHQQQHPQHPNPHHHRSGSSYQHPQQQRLPRHHEEEEEEDGAHHQHYPPLRLHTSDPSWEAGGATGHGHSHRRGSSTHAPMASEDGSCGGDVLLRSVSSYGAQHPAGGGVGGGGGGAAAAGPYGGHYGGHSNHNHQDVETMSTTSSRSHIRRSCTSALVERWEGQGHPQSGAVAWPGQPSSPSSHRGGPHDGGWVHGSAGQGHGGHGGQEHGHGRAASVKGFDSMSVGGRRRESAAHSQHGGAGNDFSDTASRSGASHGHHHGHHPGGHHHSRSSSHAEYGGEGSVAAASAAGGGGGHSWGSASVAGAGSTAGGGGGESGGHIMISYEWGSQQKALMIKEALERRGLLTWMDVEKVPGSTLEAMALAVEGAVAVLLCVSKRYKESQACRAEAEYAYQQRKRIVPIMMERGYRPTGWLGILIGTKLYFDCSDRRLIGERVAALERELGPLARLCRRPGTAASASSGGRSRPASALAMMPSVPSYSSLHSQSFNGHNHGHGQHHSSSGQQHHHNHHPAFMHSQSHNNLNISQHHGHANGQHQHPFHHQHSQHTMSGMRTPPPAPRPASAAPLLTGRRSLPEFPLPEDSPPGQLTGPAGVAGSTSAATTPTTAAAPELGAHAGTDPGMLPPGCLAVDGGAASRGFHRSSTHGPGSSAGLFGDGGDSTGPAMEGFQTRGGAASSPPANGLCLGHAHASHHHPHASSAVQGEPLSPTSLPHGEDLGSEGSGTALSGAGPDESPPLMGRPPRPPPQQQQHPHAHHHSEHMQGSAGAAGAHTQQQQQHHHTRPASAPPAPPKLKQASSASSLESLQAAAGPEVALDDDSAPSSRPNTPSLEEPEQSEHSFTHALRQGMHAVHASSTRTDAQPHAAAHSAHHPAHHLHHHHHGHHHHAAEAAPPPATAAEHARAVALPGSGSDAPEQRQPASGLHTQHQQHQHQHPPHSSPEQVEPHPQTPAAAEEEVLLPMPTMLLAPTPLRQAPPPPLPQHPQHPHLQRHPAASDRSTEDANPLPSTLERAQSLPPAALSRPDSAILSPRGLQLVPHLRRENTSLSLAQASEYTASVFYGAAGAPSEMDSGTLNGTDDGGAQLSPMLMSRVNSITPHQPQPMFSLSLSHMASSTTRQGESFEHSISVSGVVTEVADETTAREAGDGKKGGHANAHDVVSTVADLLPSPPALQSCDSSTEEVSDTAQPVRVRCLRREGEDAAAGDDTGGGGRSMEHSEVHAGSSSSGSVDGRGCSSSAAPGGPGSSEDLLGLAWGGGAAEQFMQALEHGGEQGSGLTRGRTFGSFGDKEARGELKGSGVRKELGAGAHGGNQGEQGVPEPGTPRRGAGGEAAPAAAKASGAAAAPGSSAAAAVLGAAGLSAARGSVDLGIVMTRSEKSQPQPASVRREPPALSSSLPGHSAGRPASPLMSLLRPVTALVSAAVALAPGGGSGRNSRSSASTDRIDPVSSHPIPIARASMPVSPDDASGGCEFVEGFGSPLVSGCVAHAATTLGLLTAPAPPPPPAMPAAPSPPSQPPSAAATTAAATELASSLSTSSATTAALAAVRWKAINWATRRAATSGTATEAGRNSSGGGSCCPTGEDAVGAAVATGGGAAVAVVAPTGVDGDADDLVGERLAMMLDGSCCLSRGGRRSVEGMGLAIEAEDSRSSLGTAAMPRGRKGGSVLAGRSARSTTGGMTAEKYGSRRRVSGGTVVDLGRTEGGVSSKGDAPATPEEDASGMGDGAASEGDVRLDEQQQRYGSIPPGHLGRDSLSGCLQEGPFSIAAAAGGPGGAKGRRMEEEGDPEQEGSISSGLQGSSQDDVDGPMGRADSGSEQE
ncbi:hypothetical protein Agub_g1950, partial [Astrephomene gubernaculifera]